MLGAFRITDAPDTPAPLLRRAQDLLALVLLSPQRAVLREHAADELWPDAGADASKKAMRQALWQIHHATDGEGADAPRLVVTEGEALRVNPRRRLWVDVDVVADAARLAQTSAEPDDATLQRLTRAADLYRGPLLEGCYDEWCLAPRARLEDRCLTLLDALSRAHEHRGDLSAAIGWAQRLLDVEPAHERTHRRLMRLHYRTGDRTRALRQLHQCRWVLQHELGVHTSAQTEALGAAIADDAAGLVEERALVVDPTTEAWRPVAPAAAPLPAVDSPEASRTLRALGAELTALRQSVEAMRRHLEVETTR